MKKQNNPKGTLEALLVIGLILIIPLFFVIRTAAIQNAVPNTPVPVAPTSVHAPALPTAENTPAENAMKPKQPPACTFPLAQTTTEESMPEEYTFSEPQVVLTDPYIRIVNWLPDNQQVLITRDHVDEHYQSIELFNPQTGETQIYATRTTTFENPPLWVPRLNAVVYPISKLVDVDLNNPNTFRPPYNLKRQLWVSQGNPANAQLIEDAQMTLDYSPVFSVAVKPDGSEIAYLGNSNDKQLSHRKVLKSSLETSQPLFFDTTKLDYRRKNPSLPVFYNMLWRPNATQIFLYSDEYHGRYTFMLDATNGLLCEIDLFGGKVDPQSSVKLARWSADGRYLAVIRFWGQLIPTDLAVLDMETGSLYEINANQVTPSDMNGLHAIFDLAWAPDNRHLAAIGQVIHINSTVDGDFGGLYIVDFLSNQTIQIASTEKLGSIFGEVNLLWSDDGAQLLVQCPTQKENRLCLLLVKNSIQP